MVSNTLGIPLNELVERLKKMGEEYVDDSDYQELRSAMPDDFPF
jgi:hypothetical protein